MDENVSEGVVKGHARCTICNKTSSPIISTELGGVSVGEFMYIGMDTYCYECRMEIDKVLIDFGGNDGESPLY